ncbi:IgGFc-binding protein-like [Leptonychotes weddellii]|uniref:IgGFc-binding protein-like n=1 Tax=Leptonychotes weddellii TaxID=9713 RepID=A0A7F8RMI8_LEPWE|nr:IgGFc-binding protein-like [Leptonychotes weddellii]
MAALSSALLCLGALGCLWGPTVAFVDFQGRYFITAFLENGGAEKPNFRLYVSPPPKGPPTAVQVRAHPVGGPPLRRALSLQPGTTALVRLPSAVELRGSRRAAGGAVRLAASRPVGVTVVNARGRTSLDTALALPRRLLGTRYVVVTPSLQPQDRHKEFAVVAGAWPTRLRLTPPVPILLDGVEHAAGRPLLVRLEPFQALQVQSAGDLSGTRVVATHPVALLAGHSCLQARNKACGHVSEQLLPQDYWGRVYAVPPFAPAAPGPKDHVYVVADSLGSLSFWGGGAEGAQALRGGVVLHFAVDPVRPLVLRSSARLQVLFLAAAAARGGVAYNPFFALLPPVDAFSRSFALTAQPGFSNVAVLLAREPTPVLLDQQPLPNLHWRLIPGGPEPGHGQHSGESHATAPGFVWTEVAYGPEPGVVHFLETRGPPVGVLSFGTAPGAGFGTQAMGQPSVDILTEEDLNPPTEFYPLLESSLVMPLQFPGSCKDHVCSIGTTCHLVKHKPECVASTQATEIMFSPKTISLTDSNTVSFSSSKTTAVAKPGSESTPEAEPGLVSVAMNELEPQSLALVKPELEPLALKEPIPETLVVAEPAAAPFPLPVPTAERESKPKTVSKAGSETISAAKLGLKVVAVTEPGLEAVTMAKQELGTVAGSKMVSEAKSETVGVSRKGQGGITGGTCWASGLPYIYTFDGYSFPVSGGCTYMLSHCPQALPSGLPAFQLWIASSGERQPMHFVMMRIFGVTITAVKHEFGFVQVNQQWLRLPATLHDGRLRLHFRSSELWAEAGLEHEPPALRLVYDWQHALSLQVTNGYRAHVVGLCGNFNRDPTDDVGGPDPRAFLRTWALQPPDAPCHALWAAPCAKPASPPETPGPCAILAAPKGPFSPCHDVLLPAPFETSCSAWICPFPNYRPALCLTLQAYAHACQRLGVSIDSWRFQTGCPMRCPPNSHYSLCANPCPAACPGVQEVVRLPTPCAEGCECDDGFFPAGRDCVPADHCPCFHNGQYFPPGQTVLIQNCSSSCTCQLGEGVACVPFSCPMEEVCGITDGVLGCRLQATLAPAPSSVAPPLVSSPFPPLLPSPSPQCPENSHFVPCGSTCPATCANPAAPDHCSHPCAPACQCLPGYLLLGGRCVPRDHCSCFLHQGRTFWRDNCTQQCHCPTLGAPVSKLPQCWPDKCHGHCKASTGGWYHCLLAQSPPSPTVLEKSLVCMATGDFHFHTFGGTYYEFPGSCVYRLAGLCGSAPANLQHFSLDLTPLLWPRGWTKALTLLACGLRLDMSPKDLNRIRVDGILESLPFFHGHCLRAYYQGRQLCVDTDFGLSLTYDWDSLARVTLPGPYGPYLCGLCGQHGPSSSTVPVPDTWKVAEVPGCGPFCGSLCPSPCPVTKRPQFAGDAYCGLLAAAEGPFGPCHAALDPLPFMDNCLDDVCRHYGARHIVCRALAAFTVACQALGVHLRPWRTPDFCPWRCPPHSHYELCGPCCPATCAGGESCSGRGASGSRCCEGCVCDAGFVLSGAACVPEAKCGCFRAGSYRALGERRCLPEGRGSCALAGPAHVLAFDGRVLTLPPPAPSPSERCLHVLARTASQGPCAFSLDVARDGAGLLSLHLNLSEHHLQLDRTLVGVITVDGEHCRLPWVLAEGRAWATLEGRHVVVYTACGLHLMYDWGSQVRLTVPSTFHGQLVGICGAFGGKVGPLDLPLDKRSWPKGLVTNPCLLPQPNLDFSISCPTQLAQIINASELCRLLQAPDGPFGRCLGHISPKPFLRICLQDICHTHGQHLGLCDALTAFTAACQEAGIPVKLWRGPRLCPMACPPRSRYSICARTCDGGCVQPTSPAHCSTQCYEGCQCDPGLIFDGTDCVSQDHCGCFHSGRYIPVGEALVLPGCQERCMCLHGQGLQCQPFSCPQGTGCILDGGVRCCEAGEGATCRLEPGGLFITFDGFSGLTPMPVTSCAYELATLVGSRPEDPDWFHVIVDFLPCPGCTAHKPRVIIGFRDGCAAVGTNQEIWVNGQPARLPAQVCRGVVARWAEGSRVVIERSPTLRVLVGPEGAVALRASPALRGRLRAACGDYNGIAADDLILPGGLQGASLTDVFQACRARGFSNCTEKLVMPAVTQHFTA